MSSKNNNQPDEAFTKEPTDDPAEINSPQNDKESDKLIPKSEFVTEIIDLDVYKKGRIFSEFPLSKETLIGLSEKGFNLSTRSQTALIEKILAGDQE